MRTFDFTCVSLWLTFNFKLKKASKIDNRVFGLTMSHTVHWRGPDTQLGRSRIAVAFTSLICFRKSRFSLSPPFAKVRWRDSRKSASSTSGIICRHWTEKPWNVAFEEYKTVQILIWPILSYIYFVIKNISTIRCRRKTTTTTNVSNRIWRHNRHNFKINTGIRDNLEMLKNCAVYKKKEKFTWKQPGKANRCTLATIQRN